MRRVFDEYLKSMQAKLAGGDATEHTHRAALQKLLESLEPGEITATNEPRRTAVGAPDYIVYHASVPLGYVEAKDVDVNLGKTERGERSLDFIRFHEALRG